MSGNLKTLERQYLDRARSFSRQLPRGNAIPFERPDFVFDTTHGMLGVEVTRFAWAGQVSRPQSRQVSPQDVQRVLDKKAARLPFYWLPGHRTWLVIVLDKRFPQCDGLVTEDILSPSYQCSFAGVMLLDLQNAQCWQLVVTRPTVP